ncbi:hypothetical protein EDB86DRAFT_2837773 [Lactarius hatsudake]|nr:hypothetical protein EDB86DRAFT_2837773 [Lactarius hatsudake]
MLSQTTPLQPPITWGQGYLCASGEMITQTDNGDGNDFMALATLLHLFCGQVLVRAEGTHCTWSYLAVPTNLVVSLLLSSSPAPTRTTRSFGSRPLPHPPLLVWYRGYHAPTGCTSSLNLRSSRARAQSSLLPGLSSCPESLSQGTTVAPLSNPRVWLCLVLSTCRVRSYY